MSLLSLEWTRRTVRIGVTGLARSGKTALITALAAKLQQRGARVAPAEASDLPRFDAAEHIKALAEDPPQWPARTQTTSLLALDLAIPRGVLPPKLLRLELLDYPGEWLLDLPLLGQDFATWSAAALERLADRPAARDFLAFASSLPATAAADEALAGAGHRLYVTALKNLQAEGLSYLQPGRFIMPPPGPPPPWMGFFPARGQGGLQSLLARRYDACRQAVREDLSAPLFGRIDRLIVLADLLSGLHAGPAAFADAQASLGAAAAALSGLNNWGAFGAAWGGSIGAALGDVMDGVLGASWLPAPIAGLLGGGITRVAFAATKADHVADRQRGNLARLLETLAPAAPNRRATTGYFAIASVRCTEDIVWTLDGHPVSAVRGRVLGDDRLTRSYPGEVPDRPPDPDFWQHPFLALPQFEPARAAGIGAPMLPDLNLDRLLAFLLEDIL